MFGAGYGPLILIAIPLVLLFLLQLSQRSRSRNQERFQAALTVGMEVVTSSGLYARVVALDGTVVSLEVAPGTVVRWDRRGIGMQDPARSGAIDPGAEPEAG